MLYHFGYRISPINKKANPEKVFIVRQQDVKGDVITIDLNKMIAHANFSQNFTLLPNDIIYISATGMAKFNYTLEKLTPSLQFLSVGTSIAESLGIMSKLRSNLWNQTGFINSSNTTTINATSGNSSSTINTTNGN